MRIKQTSAGYYSHELPAEIFAVGQQRTILEKQYLLLDRQETSFTLSKGNQRSHVFKTKREALLTNFEVYEQPRGKKYFGYLAVVRESRGEIIAMKASSDWLFEGLPGLTQMGKGWFFDRTCKRVHPTGPKRFY